MLNTNLIEFLDSNPNNINVTSVRSFFERFLHSIGLNISVLGLYLLLEPHTGGFSLLQSLDVFNRLVSYIPPSQLLSLFHPQIIESQGQEILLNLLLNREGASLEELSDILSSMRRLTSVTDSILSQLALENYPHLPSDTILR